MLTRPASSSSSSATAVVLLLACCLWCCLWTARADSTPATAPASAGFLSWEPFDAFNAVNSADPQNIRSFLRHHNHNHYPQQQQLASDLLNGQKVYVSLTTIHSRLYGIASTIRSIIDGKLLPDHIYILISKDPYLLDRGVTEEAVHIEFAEIQRLKKVFPYISVVFTGNVGPHRKLLPLLQQKWDEDCVIITVDDHEIYKPTALVGLLQYYVASNKEAVVALRSRRMGFCRGSDPWELAPYLRNGRGLWPEAQPGLQEFLTLPTGTGGVLYRPSFFDKNVVFDRQLVNLTITGDDLMFRIATMAKGKPVVTACTAETVHIDVICPYIPLSSVSGNAQSKSSLLSSSSSSLSSNYTALNQLAVVSRDILSPVLDIAASSHSVYRVRRNLRGEPKGRKSDPRKKVSLASKYNNIGGNDVTWKNAAKYLKEKGIFDFEELVASKVAAERWSCIKDCPNCLNNQITQWTNEHCGLVYCPKPRAPSTS